MRYNVAQQLVLLAEALGPEMAQRELLAGFVALLKDSEAEVRVAAASRVARFSRLVSVEQVRPRTDEYASCCCTQRELLAGFMALLSEAEVRMAAASRVARFSPTVLGEKVSSSPRFGVVRGAARICVPKAERELLAASVTQSRPQ